MPSCRAHVVHRDSDRFRFAVRAVASSVQESDDAVADEVRLVHAHDMTGVG